ncbi:hypothetical protein HELRODRAFT_194139 [Helobdella robusta]|uniref:PHD-type domain-containing protein n=1 Tax=Helobdella robusta TaxID=6412 RepID=T1FVR0_HELRO|nr:hypothetical protein HELRODRAFT_194139 [Helobdella robusta]ESN93343.1 hypothetical protein HELRODRAFT_194139 [Helobdella robusta]
MNRSSYESDSDISISSGHSSRRLTLYSDDKEGPSTNKLNFLKNPSSNNNNNGKHEKPAELFRKDLISAMKMADTEVLHPEDYMLIADPWRQEWERGVQVPVNSQILHASRVRPKKLLHAMPDDQYKVPMHELHETHKLAEEVCRYDLDDVDIHWLKIFNELKSEFGQLELPDWLMEKLIEELENRCYSGIKAAEAMGMEYDEDTFCDVCRLPDVEEGNEMVFCDGCDVGVHQVCYGILKIPKGSWVCRACAVGLKPRCALCTTQGGAMKSTKDGSQWAHLSCALWVPEVTIACSDKMEPIDNIDDIPMTRWNLICCVCKERSGACIQCCVKKCKTSFHVTCGFKMNYHMKLNLEDNDKELQFKAYCGAHSRNKDSLTPTKTSQTDDGSSEGKKIAEKSRRLRKIVDEFYTYVNVREVANTVGVDLETASFVFEYWKLKRKSNFNKALLTPKMEEGDILLRQRQDSLMARLRMFIHLRQDLERVRNLCYMVTKRERTRCQLHQTKHNLFMQQADALHKNVQSQKLSSSHISSHDSNHHNGIGDGTDCKSLSLNYKIISQAHKIDESIYDKPADIRRAARIYENRLASEPLNESDDEGDFKYNFYFTSTQNNSNSNNARSYCSSMSAVSKGMTEKRLSINDLLKCQQSKTVKKSKSSIGLKQQSNIGSSGKKVASPHSSLSTPSLLASPSSSSSGTLSASASAAASATASANKKLYKTDRKSLSHHENPYAKSYNNFAWLLLSNRKKKQLEEERMAEVNAKKQEELVNVEKDGGLEEENVGQVTEKLNYTSKNETQFVNAATDEKFEEKLEKKPSSGNDDEATPVQRVDARLNVNESKKTGDTLPMKCEMSILSLNLKRLPLRDVDEKSSLLSLPPNKKFKSSFTPSFIPLYNPQSAAVSTSTIAATPAATSKKAYLTTPSSKTSSSASSLTTATAQSASSSTKKSRKSKSFSVILSLPSSKSKVKMSHTLEDCSLLTNAHNNTPLLNLSTSSREIEHKDIDHTELHNNSDTVELNVMNVSSSNSANKFNNSPDKNVFANITEFSLLNRKDSSPNLQKNEPVPSADDYQATLQRFSTSFMNKIGKYKSKNSSKLKNMIRNNGKPATESKSSCSAGLISKTAISKSTSGHQLISTNKATSLEDCTKITKAETQEDVDITGSYDGDEDNAGDKDNKNNDIIIINDNDDVDVVEFLDSSKARNLCLDIATGDVKSGAKEDASGTKPAAVGADVFKSKTLKTKLPLESSVSTASQSSTKINNNKNSNNNKVNIKNSSSNHVSSNGLSRNLKKSPTVRSKLAGPLNKQLQVTLDRYLHSKKSNSDDDEVDEDEDDAVGSHTAHSAYISIFNSDTVINRKNATSTSKPSVLSSSSSPSLMQASRHRNQTRSLISSVSEKKNPSSSRSRCSGGDSSFTLAATINNENNNNINKNNMKNNNNNSTIISTEPVGKICRLEVKLDKNCPEVKPNTRWHSKNRISAINSNNNNKHNNNNNSNNGSNHKVNMENGKNNSSCKGSVIKQDVNGNSIGSYFARERS